MASARSLGASMGPPFENGGGGPVRTVQPPSPLLQWGRRSKTAEGRGLCCDCGVRRRLQWGRRSKTAEGRGLEGRSSVGANASMGPPFENGGGSGGAVSGRRFSQRLQWGRRSKRRREGVGSAGSIFLMPLQWGRRSKTAEGVPAKLIEHPESYSASMGPPFENGGGAPPESTESSPLQGASMGPPFENGGGRQWPATSTQSHPLQWGRRSKTAEGSVLCPLDGPKLCGFNGAAVRKRRRGGGA